MEDSTDSILPQEQVTNPEIRTGMQETMTKLETRNVELGGKMLAFFGEGPTRALLLTQPTEFPDPATGKLPDFLVVTQDGYMRITMELTGEIIKPDVYNILNNVVRERNRNPTPTDPEEGYLVKEEKAYPLTLPGTPTREPVMVTTEHLSLRGGI